MMRTNTCVALLLSVAGCSIEDVTYRAPVEPDATVPIDARPPDADPFVAIAMQCVAVGYTLDPASNGYYRAVATSTSWTLAQADCVDDVAGATHLIVLSKASEVTYMATRPGWIGLSDRVTEGTFVTVTGETDDQRPWRSGQPDNGSNEDCTEMEPGGLINDQQCGDNLRYVCECDGRMSTP